MMNLQLKTSYIDSEIPFTLELKFASEESERTMILTYTFESASRWEPRKVERESRSKFLLNKSFFYEWICIKHKNYTIIIHGNITKQGSEICGANIFNVKTFQSVKKTVKDNKNTNKKTNKNYI